MATPGQVTDQELRDFFAANPNISDEQTYQLMQQYQVSPQQVISARGLDPQQAGGQYNQQVVNQARPGQVSDEQLKAYFANNPNVPDSQVYALMNQYQVSPEQVSRAVGIPLSEAQDRYRSARYENIPTGVGGAEDAMRQGLTDATGTLRGAETSSRADIDAALNRVNELYGININDLRSAGTTAGSYFQPFQQGGTAAFNQQLALSGALGQGAFDQARQESPYEKFLFEQGMRANLAGASATGGLGGGNVQKELQRFGQGLSSQGLQQQIGNLNTLSGYGMQAAGALGDITMNTAGNIAGQRGAMASAEGTAGLNRANIGQTTGQNIATMQYGTGQDIGAGRTRAGELQANQLQNFYANQSNLLSGMGAYNANLIGDQTSNLIGMGGDAATRAASLATGLAGNIAGMQTNLAQNQNSIYGGAARINAPSFDYGASLRNATNAAAGGYDLGTQAVYQPRQGGYAPVSESQPQRRDYYQTMPNSNAAPQPYQVPGATYNVGLGRFN